MPRLTHVARLFITNLKGTRKPAQRPLRNALLWRCSCLMVLLLFGAGFLRAQAGPGAKLDGPARSNDVSPTPHQAQPQSEVEELRNEVKQLREELEHLRALIVPPPQEKEAAAAAAASQPQEIKGAPQSTAVPYDPRLALATKANGGDLSGLGNLLRTDRITLGGYGDVQFREASLNEKNDGGGTSTFQSTRFVLGLAAVLARKQNIVFNSEIEYELGTSEIDIEQAFVDWKMRPELSLRGGIIVPAIGRFNTYHDSNLNLLTLRPLINQYIVPTAYRDTGIGIRGRISLPREMKLTYEVDVLNGMQRLNADGNPTPFSRIVGQSSAAEPGRIGFQDNNGNKAMAGRIGFSPVLGLEFGGSVYNGKFNNFGESPQSVTIVFLDASYQRGPLAINGEYGRSNVVGGGIPRRSPAPPVANPKDPASITALAQFVAQPSPGQDGFYGEVAYKFRPFGRWSKKFDEGAYIAPVIRYEEVRLDRTIPDFYLNRSRVTTAINFAPSSSVIFKLGYAFNHTFGPVPNIQGPVGSADFGNNPIPFREYGKNGFIGSLAYVF